MLQFCHRSAHTARHMVEGLSQYPQLIVALYGHFLIQRSRGDPLRGACHLLDWPRDDPAEQHTKGQPRGHHDCNRHQHHVPRAAYQLVGFLALDCELAVDAVDNLRGVLFHRRAVHIQPVGDLVSLLGSQRADLQETLVIGCCGSADFADLILRRLVTYAGIQQVEGRLDGGIIQILPGWHIARRPLPGIGSRLPASG